MPRYRQEPGNGSRLQDYVTFNQNGVRRRTLTFGIPQSFYHALAADLGRPGDLASDPEVEEYLREVIKTNLTHVIEVNQPKPMMRIPRHRKTKMTIRRRP